MKVKLLEYGIMPKKGRADDAAFDIFLPQDIFIWPNETVVINTGVCVEIPDGYAGMLVIRSSISKAGLIIQPPLIDKGYTGELHIIAVNTSNNKLQYNKGNRICSLLIFPIFSGELELVSELSKTDRNDSWSGSSGK